MERSGSEPGDVEELAPSEAARTRHRDRKRTVRMVVDNAGVKRILLARAARQAAAREGDHKTRER
ncbi:MAG TPA: hypothetical protein VMU20_03815 [Candidatus Dormibacteraeota bacterium]|jgi:hypothetical protein|nr:hypothetical protein [Candidatus Dormibacteraeota bacterium]